MMATLRTAPCNCDGGCQKCEYTGSVLWTDYSDDKVISSTPLLRPRIAQLEAENAALKAEVERLKLEGVTDRARAMLNDVTNERNGLHNEIAAIRAKLERAEAVVDAVLSGRAYKVDEALAAWRKPP